jgi:protein-tyrosine-phosphatase
MPLSLEDALARARAILFLCSGNVVRSAFAELYARHRGVPVPLLSAATEFRNDFLFPETHRALLLCDVEPAWMWRFRPRHLDDVLALLDPATVVFGMTARHLQAVAREPALAERSFLLAELVGERFAIADPVQEGADYGETFATIARCIDALAARFDREVTLGA